MITEELLAAFEEGKNGMLKKQLWYLNIWRLMKVCKRNLSCLNSWMP